MKVRVTVAAGERRRLPQLLHLAVLVLVTLVTSAGVLVAVRLLGSAKEPVEPGVPVSVLDANSTASVKGSTRLALLGPLPLLDARATGALAPKAVATVPLPPLPPGSTAVLVEVSMVQATGAGPVTLASEGAEVSALQLSGPGAQSSATVVVPIGQSGQLRVRTAGGGRVVVNLIGAFEPAETATAGRIVPLPTTRIIRLVPKTSGKEATVDLASVPALKEAGSVAAVLLQVSADVGTKGGYVTTDGAADKPDQQVYWAATAGTDRTRSGFLVVPVIGSTLRVHYEAGSLLTVDLVGYVTDAKAASATAGLVVPVGANDSVRPIRVAAGKPSDVTVVGKEKVVATLLGLSAIGDSSIAGVKVYPPDVAAPADPNLVAADGAARNTLVFVRTVSGSVRVATTAGALITLTPQALILG